MPRENTLVPANVRQITSADCQWVEIEDDAGSNSFLVLLGASVVIEVFTDPRGHATRSDHYPAVETVRCNAQGFPAFDFLFNCCYNIRYDLRPEVEHYVVACPSLRNAVSGFAGTLYSWGYDPTQGEEVLRFNGHPLARGVWVPNHDQPRGRSQSPTMNFRLYSIYPSYIERLVVPDRDRNLAAAITRQFTVPAWRASHAMYITVLRPVASRSRSRSRNRQSHAS